MIYTMTLNPAVDRELTVAEIQYDTVLRASAWHVDFGGKGFNVSRMLHSLGAASEALGFVGGKSGERLRDGLEGMGIGTDFVWVPGETRTNVSIVTEVHDRYIKVNEPGPTISDMAQAAMVQRVQELVRPGDWWVLAGSLPPGVKAEFYQVLVNMIQAGGAQVVLDTSGEPLRYGCQARPYLVKPNDEELAKLTGLPVDSLEEVTHAAQAVLDLGPENVIVSLGKTGAMCVSRTGVWQAASPVVDAQNPIGAGDSLVGGVVWGLSQGWTLVEALRWGVACGAATASQPGTAVGTREMVTELVARVAVQPAAQ